ncbi:unnamed protein product (macronuclear) [Paramecium tetraurelia]|uniref:Transmembrane protein n=1 Tax=Paramecium tetraurelia TaxID=5888 RepID=A0DGH8_PARTE|nr:uncharacterized protein GSPATT00002274001 [Paramecium tetraurelia]CAK82145.1 unnamed protein product [Paramecium tetraurelia]|eukprot:XP_001449542.1 hypothetical protein (macronuclear) [Paramecium tetraurelia strain d4-2]
MFSIQIGLITALFFQNSIQTNRIRSHPNQTFTVNEESLEFQFSTQEAHVKLLSNPAIYDIIVYRNDSNSLGAYIETPFLSLDNQYLDDQQLDNDCIGLPKHPKLTEIFSVNLLDNTEDIYYTDLLILGQQQKIFLLTDELELKQAILLFNQSQSPQWNIQIKNISYNLQTLISEQVNYTNAYFAHFQSDQDRCLILSNYGGFWLNTNSEIEKPNLNLEPVINKRQDLNKVSLFEEYLAIANGIAGVDLYQYINKQLIYLLTISAEQLNQTAVNIISVKLSQERISILDEHTGLYIFKIQNGQLSLDLTISQSRCVAFDHYQNTYLVVAETPNNIEYMMEIFLLPDSKEYYINRIYVDDFSFRDIQIDEDYAIIIGEDVHLVLRHSIFNGFMRNNTDLVKTFFEDELIRFQYFDMNESIRTQFMETSYYIGLSKGSLHIWKFNDYNPVIICKFQYGREQNYTLKANTSRCEGHQITDLFEQCQITQQLSIQASGPLLESDSNYLIIGVCVSVAVILVIIVFILCRKGRALAKRIQELKQQAEEMKKYGAFQEQEQQSAEH